VHASDPRIAAANLHRQEWGNCRNARSDGVKTRRERWGTLGTVTTSQDHPATAALRTAADRRRRRAEALGIGLLVLGLGAHVAERELFRVRLRAHTMRGRADMWLDNPGGLISLVGAALIQTSQRGIARRG
jgi:hypothetical protein